MLEITNLSAGYPGRRVLDGLNLRFPEGKLCVLAGPNGSGKSTLLKAMVGILPAQGTVRLAGEALSGLPPRELARVLAYLPQNRHVPSMQALELVLQGRFPYLDYPRRYRQEDKQAAQTAMERLGIADLADRPLATLSGGQRQKVYIAMALAQDTKVLLLDEPTAFLDIGHQLGLMETLAELAKDGKTVLAVLHDLSLAMEYGQHLTVLAQGTALGQGAPEGIYRQGALERAFGVEVKRIQTPDGWKYYCNGTGKNAAPNQR